MAKTDRRITFDDFAGGYAGELPSWRLQKSMWHGLNVIAAVDGSLVPRSGLVDMELTGLDVGAISGLGWADGGAAAPDKLWYVQGTALHNFFPYVPGEAVSTATGSLSAPATRVIHAWDEAGIVWLANYGDRLYKYDLAANTLTAIPYTTGAPAGRCIVAWNSFLVTGGGPTDPSALYWSDGDAFDDWPDLSTTPPETAEPPNFEPIGSLNSAITGLFVVRGQLIVAKEDGTMWVVTGDLPTSKVPDSIFNVRQVYQGQTPLLEPQHGAVIAGQAVWMVGRSAPWPSWFNGSNMNDLNYLRTDLVPTENTIVKPNLNLTRMTGPNDLLIAGGTVGDDRLMFRSGVWSRHQFAIAGDLPWTQPMADGLVLTSDGGSSTEAPKFYVWHATGLERAASDEAPLQSVTDAGTEFGAEFTLAEWVSEDGSEALARSVVVDFRRVDQGDLGLPQQFAITVASTRRTRDETGTKWAEVQRWAGRRRTDDVDRAVFMFGDQGDGQGFLIRVFDVRGVAIQRVTVQVLSESVRVA